MVKMYLLLKLIQVPWSIKTMLDLCLLVCLMFIPATLSISCPFKQNQTKPTKQQQQEQQKTAEKLDFQQFVHTDVFLFYCGFCISTQHLQVMGFFNSITWYEKFSQETTKDCSFFFFPSFVNFLPHSGQFKSQQKDGSQDTTVAVDDVTLVEFVLAFV